MPPILGRILQLASHSSRNQWDRSQCVHDTPRGVRIHFGRAEDWSHSSTPLFTAVTGGALDHSVLSLKITEGRGAMGQKAAGQLDASRLLVPALLMVGWIVGVCGRCLHCLFLGTNGRG
ncbi:hypothetical protein SKAU_G00078420 [Synaphobranchus kaupii]|uniref:Uncharacterized protein n=1 Tax=Synaphobranchus kaupii TaxID=118154 RepID=A0A9Q1FUU1_SYNKA|nr:hypothetical protein SKAU_G00078420 [Synaphobranchus kaupii]